MENLESLYQTRFSDTDRKAKAAVWKVLCEDFFQKYIDPKDTVLDIACGMGEFLNNIKAQRKIGIDLNSTSKQFLEKETEFHNLSAENLSAIKTGEIDKIFVSNFFEHLPDKATMDKVLQEMKRVLKPKGQIIILQPNIRFAFDLYWDFYDHYLPLSDRSMVEGLGKNGFKVLEVVPRFVPFSTKSALPKGPLFVKLYLNMPFAWPLFGKQFFVLAER